LLRFTASSSPAYQLTIFLSVIAMSPRRSNLYASIRYFEFSCARPMAHGVRSTLMPPPPSVRHDELRNSYLYCEASINNSVRGVFAEAISLLLFISLPFTFYPLPVFSVIPNASYHYSTVKHLSIKSIKYTPSPPVKINYIS
jgi:hypothetical protein